MRGRCATLESGPREEQRTDDARLARVEIDIAPSKPEQFALAHAGRDCDRVDRFEWGSGRRVLEPSLLIRRQRTHLRPADARRVDEFGDIACDRARSHFLPLCSSSPTKPRLRAFVSR
ncbi:MAG: hypothetical protein QOI08_4411 [Actinomycetota bacterium]|nr:hypothetical protein [Actinomycetota bacterium]